MQSLLLAFTHFSLTFFFFFLLLILDLKSASHDSGLRVNFDSLVRIFCLFVCLFFTLNHN